MYDLHGATEVQTVLRDGQAGRTTNFTVTYAVRYVVAEEPGSTSPGNSRTLAKEVAVTVTEDTPAETGRPPVRCLLAQVITPAWRTTSPTPPPRSTPGR